MKKTIPVALAVSLLLAGCATETEPTSAEPTTEASSSNRPETSTPVAAASSSPTPTPTKETHQLGETVDRPSGASVTAHDYRVVSDVADHRVGAIDVEVCVGDENTPDGVYVTTEFWTAVSDDNRRYGDASTTWGNDEISPILDYETDVAWGDCLRGWIVTDASDDSNITKIRYFNDLSDEAGNEEIIWQVP